MSVIKSKPIGGIVPGRKSGIDAEFTVSSRGPEITENECPVGEEEIQARSAESRDYIEFDFTRSLMPVRAIAICKIGHSR